MPSTIPFVWFFCQTSHRPVHPTSRPPPLSSSSPDSPQTSRRPPTPPPTSSPPTPASVLYPTGSAPFPPLPFCPPTISGRRKIRHGHTAASASAPSLSSTATHGQRRRLCLPPPSRREGLAARPTSTAPLPLALRPSLLAPETLARAHGTQAGVGVADPPLVQGLKQDAAGEIAAELQCTSDFIIGNCSDGNLVASSLSYEMGITQHNIAHALEKTKYLDSDILKEV